MRGLRLPLSAGVIDQHPANLSGHNSYVLCWVYQGCDPGTEQFLCFSSCVQPAAQMLSMWCWTGTWWQDRMRIPPFLLSRTFWFFAMSGEARWGLRTGSSQWWAFFFVSGILSLRRGFSPWFSAEVCVTSVWSSQPGTCVFWQRAFDCWKEKDENVWGSAQL